MDRVCPFSLSNSANISATAKVYLQAMALLPEDGASEKYGNNTFWGNNGKAEVILHRGGCWYNGEAAGIFSINIISPRSKIGTRSAYTSAQPLMMTLESDIMESPEMILNGEIADII